MSGLDSGNRKDYSKFDRMSTESLEELLRLDAELPDGEGSDIDEILYISEVIAKRDSEQPTGRYSEADVAAAWDTFQTKYLPYVTDGHSLYDFDDDKPGNSKDTVPDIPSPSVKSRISARGRRRLGRVASFAAAIAILLGLMTVTAYAMGYDLWGVIAQWTKDTFTFVSASKANNAENMDTETSKEEYADLQTALDAYGITALLAPRWIPDGFRIESVIIDELPDESSTSFHACYRRNEKILAIQINMYSDLNDVTYTSWQKDDVDIVSTEIQGCTFYLMTNADRKCAIWANGPFECNISGDISSDELSKMIKSIYE